MRRALFVALCSACVTAGARRSSEATHDARRTVGIQNFTFSPAVLTVFREDTVVWVNRDSFIHTTAADSGAWTSPEIVMGDRFLFVANRSGRFPYHCAAHSNMRGEIIVQ
jgi:plastocyanin